jgi:WD40 repeat protein
VAILTVVAIGIAVFLTPAPVSGPLDSTQITFSAEPKGGPLLTDGSRLYFQSRGVPSEMAVSGGNITPTPHLEPGMFLVDISADGSKLLEWKQLDSDTGRGSLWVAWSQGGAPRRVGHYLVNAAAWSPDGESIVFSDQRTLYAINADGSNARKIWEGPGILGGVCFSPDARELTVTALIFPGKENQRPLLISQLWRVKANGESAHPVLTDWPARTWSPRWTSDGQHFVFTSDREGRANVYELVAPRWFEFWKKPAPVRITGNQVPILSSTPARDSKSLFVLGRMNVGAMQVVDPRTQKLLPFLGGLSALEFVVSPDGRWMAYTDYPTGYLWKSKLDGSERLQLTNSPAFMEQWSPDGKSLAYSDWRKLYLVSADGGSLEQLISAGDNEVMPTWFADGKSIAFCYYNFMDQPPDGLYTLDLATRKVSRMPDSKGFFIPSWSPDGNFLVAIAQNPSRMMLYSPETKAWSVLTQLQAPWGYWRWSSDSKSLYMGILQSGIYRLAVPDGKWEKVTGLEGVDAREPNAFVSLTADGQPAIMTHIGDAQIYSLHWTN